MKLKCFKRHQVLREFDEDFKVSQIKHTVIEKLKNKTKQPSFTDLESLFFVY